MSILRNFKRISITTVNVYHSNSFCYECCMSTMSGSQKSGDKIKLPHASPENIQHDWIGPSDPVSNIRQFKYHIPKDETLLQKQLRLRREEVQEWNHNFWVKHNRNFQQEKTKFIDDTLTKLRSRGQQVDRLSADDLAVFYKRFLDENYQLHKDYNREWYKKNIGLLWPAFKASVEKFFSLKK